MYIYVYIYIYIHTHVYIERTCTWVYSASRARRSASIEGSDSAAPPCEENTSAVHSSGHL